MEKVTLTLQAPKTLDKSVQLQNGVVSSGDLEVVFESSDGDTLTVIIKSSVDWKALFSRIQQFNSVPAGRMLINDFGASPGVVRLRVEQVLDEAEHA